MIMVIKADKSTAEADDGCGRILPLIILAISSRNFELRCMSNDSLDFMIAQLHTIYLQPREK